MTAWLTRRIVAFPSLVVIALIKQHFVDKLLIKQLKNCRLSDKKTQHFSPSKDVITNFCHKKLVVQPDRSLLCVFGKVAVYFEEGFKLSA